MKRYRRRRRRRRHGWRWLALLAALIALVVWLDGQLMPLVKQYAVATAKRNALLYIDESISEILASSGDLYGELMTVTEDADGNVKSLRADVAKINRLKAQITTRILRHTASAESQDFSIPIGTVLGGALLTGRGPRIPVRVNTAGSVLSRLYSSFSDAGINQTNHQIFLDITVRFFVAIPSLYYAAVEVSSECLIAESVLIGDVPDSFTSVNDDRSDLIGKIFDYADIDL